MPVRGVSKAECGQKAANIHCGWSAKVLATLPEGCVFRSTSHVGNRPVGYQTAALTLPLVKVRVSGLEDDRDKEKNTAKKQSVRSSNQALQ